MDEQLAGYAPRDDLRARAAAWRAELDLTQAGDCRERFAALKREAIEQGVDLPNPHVPDGAELRAALARRPELLAALRPALARRAIEVRATRANAARAYLLRRAGRPRTVRGGTRRRSSRTSRARAPGREPGEADPPDAAAAAGTRPA